jgi:hemerythrin-like domain-containing protein
MSIEQARPMEMRTSPSRDARDAWRFDGFEALDVCHLETQRMLSQFAALVDEVEQNGTDLRLRGLATSIAQHFSTTMREHHEDEERHVFPGLSASADAQTAQALACLVQDHFWLDSNWRELAPLLDAAISGHAGCDLDALRRGVEIFAALCREHIELEESLIYPQAILRMADSDRQSMNREMALRRHGTRPVRERG